MFLHMHSNFDYAQFFSHLSNIENSKEVGFAVEKEPT